MGLCSQVDLDGEVRRAAKRIERERIEAGLPPVEIDESAANTLLPADETADEVSVLRRREDAMPSPERKRENERPLTAEDVFGRRDES